MPEERKLTYIISSLLFLFGHEEHTAHLIYLCRDVVVMDSDDEFEDANDDVMDDEDIFGAGSGSGAR